MNKYMRKYFWSLGSVLAILAIIFLLLPFIMGFVAEKKCQQLTGAINSTTPFQAKITNYSRGWFCSHATVQMSFEQPQIVNQELRQVIANVNITHGPIIIDKSQVQVAMAIIKAAFNLSEAQNVLLHRDADAGPVVVAKIKIKLNTKTDIVLESSPLSYQDAENTFQWQGIKT
ncbi:MAG: hypothetical protein ACD_21C00283G0003 [uncultured bacterium]|nr:MAG: hypothetical protein ACD_21C00283G0003 [uncultured bacterium]